MNLQQVIDWLRQEAPPEGGRGIREMKRAESMFIGTRWFAAAIILAIPWLHHPSSRVAMMMIASLYALGNVAAYLINPRITTIRAQRVFSAYGLALDALTAWGGMFLFAWDKHTSAYAGFVFVIIEGSIRFGLAGSLSMALVFAGGLYGAYTYRLAAYDIEFTTSGYAFWTTLMLVVSLPIGLIVQGWNRERTQNERLLREKTLLAERNRIARELHDDVFKTLQGLALSARALKQSASSRSPSVEQSAAYIEQICQRTSSEIRDTIFDLRSGEEAESVGSWLPRMLEEWKKSTGIPVEFRMTGDDLTLPPTLSDNMRKAVSEALTNIQRHASASHVRAELKVTNGQLDIELADDGRGIKYSIDDIPMLLSQGKLGIAGIKERVELTGGQLAISGSNGKGTRVRLSLPIEAAAAAGGTRGS